MFGQWVFAKAEEACDVLVPLAISSPNLGLIETPADRLEPGMLLSGLGGKTYSLCHVGGKFSLVYI